MNMNEEVNDLFDKREVRENPLKDLFDNATLKNGIKQVSFEEIDNILSASGYTKVISIPNE